MKCGCRLTVQLISHAESRAVTMPPVTTFPLNGSRLQMRSMCSGMRRSSVVTVADCHLVSGMSVLKTSGRPNDGSLAATRRHRSHAGAGPVSRRAGVCWSPLSEFSVSEPMVAMTRSSSPRSIVRSTAAPPDSWAAAWSSRCSRVATLRSGARSKSTSVTSTWNRNVTPWSMSQRVSGSTIDSYWLYLVNLSAERSGRPPTWWMNRCR
ncbi:Uncharacterised protein [Mycobacteroides abscessus]|nr:Uncharacterised protein [Mycobacteroides abscessus]